jgi:formylglycine-generating enzyme required for sulfatase activity
MLKDIRNAALGALAVLALAAPATAQSCAGDLDGSGEVDGADLGTLLNAWGSCSSCAADLNGDGAVNGTDLGTLLANWDACQIITPSWATLVEARPDPAVVTDPALLAAIEATGLAWRVRDTATQVEMLLVPPGTFQMGCIMGFGAAPPYQDPCNDASLPVHEVSLTKAYYLGRYELTQAQWEAQMGSNPSYFSFSWWPASSRCPVEQVTWDAVQHYLRSTGMRLPTEAEWEYACRAGTQTPYYDGSTDYGTLVGLAWFLWNSSYSPIELGMPPEGSASIPGTHPIGSKAANAMGFHDMLGNVYELVSDWWGFYAATPETDPTGPNSGEAHVVRGGSWGSGTNVVHSDFRDYGPGYGSETGFRVARNP